MNNTVCRNFNYNEKADDILNSIHLNCDGCEFNGHCDIETAYHMTKDLKTGHWIDDKCSVCGKGTEDLISSPEWYEMKSQIFARSAV